MDTLEVPEMFPNRNDARISIETSKPDVEHCELQHTVSYQGSILSFFLGEEQARQASMYEQRMTLRYALHHYKVAVKWVILMAAPALMEGYQTFLMSAFSSFQPFCRFYGASPAEGEAGQNIDITVMNDTDGDGYLDHSLATHWQCIIPIGTALGQIAGLVIAPRLSAWFGYRRCIIGGIWNSIIWLGLLVGASFLSHCCASSVRMSLLVVGEFFLGGS